MLLVTERLEMVVGRSFLNANQPTVLGRTISFAVPNMHLMANDVPAEPQQFEHRLHKGLVGHPGSLRVLLEPFKEIGWNTKGNGNCSRALRKQGLDMLVELLVRHVIERIGPLRGRPHL